jgi:hypothetical protein
MPARHAALRWLLARGLWSLPAPVGRSSGDHYRDEYCNQWTDKHSDQTQCKRVKRWFNGYVRLSDRHQAQTRHKTSNDGCATHSLCSPRNEVARHRHTNEHDDEDFESGAIHWSDALLRLASSIHYGVASAVRSVPAHSCGGPHPVQRDEHAIQQTGRHIGFAAASADAS